MYDSRTDKAYRPGTHRYLTPLDDEDRYWEHLGRKPLAAERDAIEEGWAEYKAQRAEGDLRINDGVRLVYGCIDETTDLADWECELLYGTSRGRDNAEWLGDMIRSLRNQVTTTWITHKRQQDTVTRIRMNRNVRDNQGSTA